MHSMHIAYVVVQRMNARMLRMQQNKLPIIILCRASYTALCCAPKIIMRLLLLSTISLYNNIFIYMEFNNYMHTKNDKFVKCRAVRMS